MICGNGRSKDSGAYDLGELDQALFLYFDGQQDPSSVQDQRRKLISVSNFFFFFVEEKGKVMRKICFNRVKSL